MKSSFTLKILKVSSAAIAGFVLLAFGSIVSADTFTGGGDGTSWEDPLNWAAGVVPPNNGGGNTAIGGHFVDFDANTWAALTAAGNLQNATQYRVVRFLLNEDASATGTGGITFDQGAGNEVLQTNSNSSIFGSRAQTTTVNVLSGTVNTGANTTFGARDGTGILNLQGGEFIVGRGNLTLGQESAGGTGIVNITGGELLTRGGANISSMATFEVVGTGSTQIGIGSQGSVDGFWSQLGGGVLRPGLDATGVTDILVDDVQGGAGAGVATFDAGSILDPYDAGGFFLNTWETVLDAEGGIIDNGLALSGTSVAAGFEQRILEGAGTNGGDLLQVRLVAVPEPSSLVLLGLGGLFFTRRRRS